MPSAPSEQPTLGDGLASRSFMGIVLTQFLGAFNDNMFRWLVVPIGQTIPALGPAKALALGGICFTAPYLLLAPAAGSLSDRYSKRNVIVGCKVGEVIIMLLGITAILLGSVWLLFGVVVLMGAQSALFAPAKYGSLPEILLPSVLSKGNGVMGLVTVVASALGIVAGYGLYTATKPDLLVGVSFDQLLPAVFALVGVAGAGVLASLIIVRQPAGNPNRPATINPITHTWPALRLLFERKPLLRTALGIAFFWFLASLANFNIDLYGTEVLGLPKVETGVLMIALVVGVAVGSILAGWWSGDRVELGLVPLGALGIAGSSMCVFIAGYFIVKDPTLTGQFGFWLSAGCLSMLGVSAGLFNVPLEAYLQARSDVSTRGTILAGSNFLTFSFIMLSSALFPLLHDVWGLTTPTIFALCGLGTIPVLFYAFRILPDITLRFLFWLSSRTLYRVRVIGSENVPQQGGALLVCNHVSFMDGVIVLTSVSRLVRFIVFADYASLPGLNWLGRKMKIIPIHASKGPKALIGALKDAKSRVENGELVCIFAEGQITRTGQMQPFQRGMLRIIDGTNAPVIPVHLYGLWGSIFSYRGGRFFWKWPRKWPYPVTINFGKPIPEPQDVHEVRMAVEQLGVEAGAMEKAKQVIPVRHFIRQSKKARSRVKVADSSGLELTGTKLLAGTLAFKRVLERNVLSPDETNVGLLVPPSVGGVLANTALAVSGRVAVNLNYTLNEDGVNHCVKAAGLKHVITSRRFLEKMPLKIEGAELVFLEDLKTQVTGLDKALSAFEAFVMPASMLERKLGLHKIDPDDLCTVIFTSGSTGVPKGVMLSHHNILSNIDAVDQLITLTSKDALVGVLPFFHSFGYTGTLWLPLCFPAMGAYHYNPLDARTVGKLSDKYNATILMATPTFLRTYMKRCTKEQFAHLELVVTGAEKLPVDLAKQFEEKYGVLPTEGYGTTEMSPIAAINVPESRSSQQAQRSLKLGTVGRVLPGCAAKVVDPDTFEDRGIATEGLLMIKGPNVMRGYLDEPEKTAELIRNGWYNTGDFAKLDDEGFIEITGRQSRFSKIGGEMVPHVRIEGELLRIIEELEPSSLTESSPTESNGETAEQGAADEQGETDSETPDLRIAVTAVPDEKKGERLIVLHKPLTVSVEDVLSKLCECGLPNLWLPSANAFCEVDDIPLLGTGKLDLRGVQDMARDLHAAPQPVAQTDR